MLSLIMVICILLCILAAVLYNLDIIDDAASGIFILSTIVFIVAFVFDIGCAIPLVNGRDIQARIEMYEEQNAMIEQQISDALDVYVSHENDVFDKVKPESAITLVSLYPELKSDALILKQCDVYIENNNKICKLKEEKITLGRYKFWVYLGR